MQKLAKKETHAKKMQRKYDGWHARADCTGVVFKKVATTPAESDPDALDEKKHPPLETGVMRLLVVSRDITFLCMMNALTQYEY